MFVYNEEKETIVMKLNGVDYNTDEKGTSFVGRERVKLNTNNPKKVTDLIGQSYRKPPKIHKNLNFAKYVQIFFRLIFILFLMYFLGFFIEIIF